MGRIQSREYQKKLDTGEVVTKVAFEVSVSKMEVCDKINRKVEPKEEQEENRRKGKRKRRKR